MAKAAKDVTQVEIARLLGIDVRSVRRYHKGDNPIPTVRRGATILYPDAPCIRWWVEYQIAQQNADTKISELDLAKQRKEIAAARKIELEVAELERSLMPVELHERRLLQRCEELAGRVRGLNRFVTRIRAARTDEEADAVADEMEDELMDALRDAAEAVPDVEEPNGDRAA